MTKQEFSFGIIPLRKQKNQWEVLLLKHGKGHWAFPKGHPENRETPEQTAERELQEEAGIQVKKFFAAPPLKEHYFFSHDKELISKTVVYFLAETTGEVNVQIEEISDFCWLPLEKAEEKMTFKEGKRLCREAIQLLNSLNA